MAVNDNFGLIMDSRKSVGIVIRLSNKNHLHRLSCKRLLKLVQAGLHREQKGIERLHDGFACVQKGIERLHGGFARVQKGLEVSSWVFCTCTKGY